MIMWKSRPLRIEDGSHIVGLYTEEDRVLSSLIPFLAEGLAGNDRCFYAAAPNTIARVSKALRQAGAAVDEARERGQLVLLDKKDPLLNDGRFDPVHLVELYRADIANALEEGWSHVRATAEMSWLVEGVPGREEILYYEALSTELFNDTDSVHAICQYDTARMKGAEIIELLKIHPWALLDDRVGDNPFWINPTVEMYHPG